MKVIIALLCLFVIRDVSARLFVDVEMNAKRVIDQNLKLASEVHVTKEIFDSSQIIEVIMRNGYRLLTQIEFITENEDASFIGPSHFMKLRSKIVDPTGKSSDENSQIEKTIELGGIKDLDIKHNDLQFTIKIRPYLK